MPDPTIPDCKTIESLTALARDGMYPKIETAEFSTPLIIWPRGQRVESMEQFLANPLAKRGTFKAQTSDAFISYVRRHQTPGTLLHGVLTTERGSFHADLDGHEGNERDTETGKITIEGEPSWRLHHAHLDLQPSPEWVKWLGNNGRVIEQVPFAEFIEDNANDILAIDGSYPDAATMLSIATTLEASTEVSFASGVRLSNGSMQLNYNELVNGQAQGAEGKISIPGRFALAIQPFVGAPKYQLKARLRYYCSRGKVTFKYELERPYRVIEDAYKGELEKIQKEVGLPVLLGSY
jgi:uncharacterized protein YfdQ (DUF2303 family)